MKGTDITVASGFTLTNNCPHCKRDVHPFSFLTWQDNDGLVTWKGCGSCWGEFLRETMRLQERVAALEVHLGLK